MSNQYIYNSYLQYSPVINHSSLNGNSPILNNVSYLTPPDSAGSSYSFHTPRLRYYLSKSFDAEDDLEFCPDIPELYSHNSPTVKKFNPYTASVFSPNQEPSNIKLPDSPSGTPKSHLPRVNTPRLKKPLEIVNPQTKMRISSPSLCNK